MTDTKPRCMDCAYFRNIRIGVRGSIKGSCTKRTTISWQDWRYGKTPACKRFEKKEEVMDKGLSDLIEELREYAAPRKGELAGMILEAANRLEKQAKVIRDCMAIREWSPGWMTKREPSPAEVDWAGDVGFICCVSGTDGFHTFDHAIIMDDCFYEGGLWCINGIHDKRITIDGWMLPPSWESEEQA